MSKLTNFLDERFILSVVIVIIGIIALVLVNRFSRKRENGKKRLPDAKFLIAKRLSRIFKLIIILCIVLFVSQIYGINITSAVAGLGIVSAVIGLALQDILKDIIMGFNISADHFYGVGECVEYMSRECLVLDFSARSTKLKDLDDGSVITVCNREITAIRRLSDIIEINIPLSYTKDVSDADKLLIDICKTVKEQNNVKKCEYEGTESFESSAVLYRVKVYCEPVNRPAVRRKALSIIKDSLDKNKVPIPFSQMDVHIDKN